MDKKIKHTQIYRVENEFQTANVTFLNQYVVVIGDKINRGIVGFNTPYKDMAIDMANEFMNFKCENVLSCYQFRKDFINKHKTSGLYFKPIVVPL